MLCLLLVFPGLRNCLPSKAEIRPETRAGRLGRRPEGEREWPQNSNPCPRQGSRCDTIGRRAGAALDQRGAGSARCWIREARHFKPRSSSPILSLSSFWCPPPPQVPSTRPHGLLLTLPLNPRRGTQPQFFCSCFAYIPNAQASVPIRPPPKCHSPL